MFDKDRPRTVRQLLQWAALFLGKEKRLEAEVMLAEICQYSRAKLLAYPEEILPEERIDKFIEFVKLRKKGEPLQYLLGKQNFMGLDFKVNKNVLIPRSDTEVLVEEVINTANTMKRSLSILDLCTGSGAIAVSLAKYIPKAVIAATDISEKALKVAKINAEENKVDDRITFLKGDLLEPVGDSKFDIIVSNPPYVSTKEMTELPKDIRREPFIALWGGEDGLDFYRRITDSAYANLKKGGFLMLEIGWQQAQSVYELCIQKGFNNCIVLKDWSDKDRVVKASK